MQTSDVSLRHLQRALTMELTTVNTYLLQEHILDDWGVDQLAERMRSEIDEERHHAHLFLERLLFLEGVPNVHDLDEIGQDKSVRDVFERQLKMENEARDYYDRAARECRDNDDLGSFDLFMRILRDEEEHVDFAETQIRLMDQMGDQLYIARQVSSVASQDES